MTKTLLEESNNMMVEALGKSIVYKNTQSDGITSKDAIADLNHYRSTTYQLKNFI